MKKTNKIIAIALIGISYVSAVMTFTALTSINADVIAYQEIAALPDPYLPEPEENYTVADLSRQVISQVYGTELPSTRVLGDTTPAPQTLTQEQISDITNPAILRVFNYITGSITIPEFNIDFKTLNLVPLEQTYTEPVEELGTGTGFLVSDNGHLITNAHVADQNIALESFKSKAIVYYAAVLLDSIVSMSPEQQRNLEEVLKEKYGLYSEEAADLLAQDMLKFISEFIDKNAVMDLEHDVTVLDPSVSKGKINTKRDVIDLAKASLPAKVIDISKNYNVNKKDVALLQIDQINTPSVLLNPDSQINNGQKIYVVGYPANATIDQSDLFFPTITEGSIGSIKDLDGVKVYQTDAKISPGSSGGPVLNSNGEVVGMLTFLTSGEVGDSFAFAIPIRFATELLTRNDISNKDAKFANNFLTGISFKSESLCRKANDNFNSLTSMNALFNSKLEVQKYIDECNQTIAAGQSLDSPWDIARSKLKTVPIYAWAGGAAIVGILLGAYFFIKRTKREQQVVMPVNSISQNSV